MWASTMIWITICKKSTKQVSMGLIKWQKFKLGCITSELKVITCFSGVTYILNIPAIYYYFFGFSQPLHTHKSSGITALILHVQEVFYQEGCVVTFYISTCHYGEMKKCDKYATQIWTYNMATVIYCWKYCNYYFLILNITFYI